MIELRGTIFRKTRLRGHLNAVPGNAGTVAKLGEKEITQNGQYAATNDGYDGYSSVLVNVPAGASAKLGEKEITKNGQYAATNDGYDGYSSVLVNVPVSAGFGGVVHTEVSGLSVASYKTNSGVNYYSCTYGKNLTVSSAGTLTVDEKLTATSAYSLENLKSALLGNYLVSGSSIYYIPEDATFTTSSNTANYITTNTLRVNKAYLVSTTDEVIDSYRGNATAEDIVKGKKAVVDGELLDGTHAEPIVTLTNGVLSIV